MVQEVNSHCLLINHEVESFAESINDEDYVLGAMIYVILEALAGTLLNRKA
jgi:hypothetical protein